MRRLEQAALVALLFVSCAAGGKKKKKAEPAGPVIGWHQATGALGACWHPPDFASMGIGARRAARDEALQAMLSQWTGTRGDGVSFDTGLAEGIETILLGYPDKIEDVARQNLLHCQKAMNGEGSGGWGAWLSKLPGSLVKGECLRPLDVTMYWYVDLGMGWQGPASVCKDQEVRITASSADKYRVEAKGPWIDAGGDPSKPASGPDLPCNIEGCYAGQLVMRFRGESGAEIVKPVGLQLLFRAPEHGSLEFAINDVTYFDNEWKVERGLQHRTSVTYEPVD